MTDLSGMTELAEQRQAMNDEIDLLREDVRGLCNVVHEMSVAAGRCFPYQHSCYGCNTIAAVDGEPGSKRDNSTISDRNLSRLSSIAIGMMAPCDCRGGGVWGEFDPVTGEPSIRFCTHHWGDE